MLAAKSKERISVALPLLKLDDAGGAELPASRFLRRARVAGGRPGTRDPVFHRAA